MALQLVPANRKANEADAALSPEQMNAVAKMQGVLGFCQLVSFKSSAMIPKPKLTVPQLKDLRSQISVFINKTAPQLKIDKNHGVLSPFYKVSKGLTNKIGNGGRTPSNCATPTGSPPQTPPSERIVKDLDPAALRDALQKEVRKQVQEQVQEQVRKRMQEVRKEASASSK